VSLTLAWARESEMRLVFTPLPGVVQRRGCIRHAELRAWRDFGDTVRTGY
jgi:hypothetical protein